MPMLGDLLAAARDGAGGFPAWLAASDPDLAGQVAGAAGRMGVTPSGYVRAAVADFARFAAEEDWATLVSSLRDSADPGTICLLAMVHWRLNAAGCDGHSHADHDAEGACHERSLARQS